MHGPINIRSILILYSNLCPRIQVVLFLQVSTPNLCMHFTSPLYMPHSPFTSPFISSNNVVWRLKARSASLHHFRPSSIFIAQCKYAHTPLQTNRLKLNVAFEQAGPLLCTWVIPSSYLDPKSRHCESFRPFPQFDQVNSVEVVNKATSASFHIRSS